jgi:hypothetical protein
MRLKEVMGQYTIGPNPVRERVNHQCQAMSELCRPSVVWRAAKCHCQDFCYIFKKNKFKALNTLLNSAKYIIKRERVFLFLCLQILLGHSNSGRLNVTITSKVVVYTYASAERFLALIHFYIKIRAVTGQSKHCPTFSFSA